MKKLWDEFKSFAFKGRVIDLAIGVVIGGAFGAIVTSLVNDIISPLIGLFFDTDLSVLTAKIGNVEISYGSFITAIINFFIIAIVLFLIVRSINAAEKKLAAKKEEAPAEPTTKICPYCKSEIAIGATRCPHCTSKLDD